MLPPRTPVIIIVGPTASGKSALAESLAQELNGEIINADVGQFYAPLSIGTAKPDLDSVPVPHHLFDICTGPEDLNVVRYRNLVLDQVTEVAARGKVPFIVGGSLFYIKSLFFPPREFEKNHDAQSSELPNTWDMLNSIDPARAAQLHPNDLYRITRALDIWRSTGVLPSQARPQAEKPFEPLFIWIDVDNEALKSRIALRTTQMLDTGWIEETKNVLKADASWRPFFDHKGLIGYTEIANWLDTHEQEAHENNRHEVDLLAQNIVNLTYWYAKRQKTFWRSFKEQVLAAGIVKAAHVIESDTKDLQRIQKAAQDFLSGQ